MIARLPEPRRVIEIRQINTGWQARLVMGREIVIHATSPGDKRTVIAEIERHADAVPGSLPVRDVTRRDVA